MKITTGLRLVAMFGLLGMVSVGRAELTINWANRATAGFTAAEEAVVDASIQLWKQALPTPSTRTFNLTITRQSLGGPIASLLSITQNPLGDPVAGSFAIESSTTFFVDPTPLDNSEYAPSTENPGYYGAINGDARRNFDLLSLVNREICHLIGFLPNFDRFDSRIHPVTPFTFQGESFSVPLNTNYASTVDRFDLMNGQGIFISERLLPSAVDIAVLNDAYDYSGRQIYNYAGSTFDIPDQSVTPFYLNVTDQGTITDVDIALRISHLAGSDLELTLVSPTGTRVTLAANIGAGANYGTAGLWSRFDDEAIRYPLSTGASPFNGTYQAAGLLSTLNGQNTAGLWTLEVNDSVGANSGTLVGFSLIFKSTPITAHAGDFDSDGDVDGADFVAWQTNFPKASGATLAQGDADADGDVDGADFVVWQTNFPFPSGSAVVPVPEPGGILTLLGALAGASALVLRRR